MKYFNPSYWFKLWVLSAPLFNDKTQGINAKSIDNKKIKDWASKDITSLESIENQELTLSNNQTNLLNLPLWNTNLTTHNQHHKHRHQKSRNRIKKQVTPHPRPSREIEKLTEKLIIDKDNSDEYTNSFQRIRNFLIERNVFIPVFDSNDWYITNLYNDNFGYFRLPVAIRWQQDGQSIERNLELVFSTDALYLQGFIITERGSNSVEISTYYYFNPRLGTSSGQYNPQLETIPNTNSIMLSHIGNSYIHLLPIEDTNIYWVNIFNAFITLTNDINADRESSLGSLALSLGRVILVTAEALRFRHWVNSINNQLITNRSFFSIGLNNNNNIYQLLIRWSQTSQTTDTFILNRIYNQENNINEYESIYRELIQRINRIRNEDERNFQHDVVEELRHYSIDFLRTLLNRSGVSVPLLGTILSLQIHNYNCNRQKRELKNTYWHEKFCDLKPEIDKIQGKITAIKVLDEKTQGGNLKVGTIYVGTENGVYLTYPEGEVHKFNNLNFPIKDIILDGNGSAYVINEKCEIYHLNLIGWDSKKENMESCDLNKELKIYYNNDKAREQINFEPSNSEIRKKRIFTLNLGKINPVDNYKKIELLGDYYSDKWGTRVKWGSYIYDSNHITNKGKNSDIGTVMREGSNKLVDNIKNYKVNDDTTMWWVENHYAPLLIQSVSDTDFIAWVEGLQKFGFTFYWENENYYLQAITFQYLDWRASEASLECWMKIGNGIRLYNDDENIRIKREIFDKNNLEDKPNKRVISNELKNLTKWTNDFTKSINNEQYLAIDNKSNFVRNNITSL